MVFPEGKHTHMLWPRNVTSRLYVEVSVYAHKKNPNNKNIHNSSIPSQPQTRNNLNTHQELTGYFHTMEYYTATKRNELLVRASIWMNLIGIKLSEKNQKKFLYDFIYMTFSSFSQSFMSNSLWPHGLQHSRLPCPSPTPRAYSNSCSLSWWCHPTISSSVIPFSSRFQSFQHQGLFQWVSSSHQVAKVLEFLFFFLILFYF